MLAAVGSAVLALVALTVVHLLKRDLDPCRTMISRYALGPYGWLMALCFSARAAASALLFLALASNAESSNESDESGGVPMSHPDPHGQPDLTPITVGEVFENPVTRERSVIVERPWDNPAERLTSETTALVGSRVAGEHHHPALVERFTVLEGELTVKCDGQTRMLRQGETAVIQAGVWHDWWNAADRDARVRVEVTPGERFAHMIETFFGLARLGHTDRKGMPHVLQLALTAREFSDVIVFRSPPPAVQRTIFGALAPIARWRGYRATYPQISRTVLAPRNVAPTDSRGAVMRAQDL